MLGVGSEEGARLVVVALAEEIGFAHSGVGKFSVVSKERRKSEAKASSRGDNRHEQRNMARASQRV